MARSRIRKSLIFCFLLAELGRAIPAIESASPSREVLRTLEKRQSSCPGSSPVSCQAVDSNLPNNFCCKTGSQCISLDASSSALCCPSGSSCSAISPIDCNVDLQDASQGREEPVFTTRLKDTLPQCGTNQCCPFGYVCGRGSDGAAVCQIIASRAITQQPSSSAGQTSTTTSSAPSSTSGARSSVPATDATSATSKVTSTTTAPTPGSASGIDSTKPTPEKTSNPFPAGVFLAGFFPGILVGALGVLAWVILTGRHKKTDSAASSTQADYDKRKLYISGPVPNSTSSRADFLRKGSNTAKTIFNTKRKQSVGTPGLPFDNWKMPTPPVPNNIPDQPMGQQIPAGPGARIMPNRPNSPPTNRFPKTPERQIYGEQTGPGPTEEIRVYTPNDVQPPPAAIAPVRGLNSRDRRNSSRMENPFISPQERAAMNARPAPPPPPNNGAGLPPAPYQPSYEKLTPARYEANPMQRRPRPETSETTFTAMLQAINFPDPMSRQPPQVPNMPKQYR